MCLCCEDQSMEENFHADLWGVNEPHQSCLGDEDEWNIRQALDPGVLLNPSLSHSNNQPGISTGVVPSQIGNVSSSQAFQSPNSSNGSVLKRNLSSEFERVQKKRKTDQAYRQRCKIQKAEMQSNVKSLQGENGSLKKENESLKKDNSLMNQTLRDKEKEIEQLRSDLLQLKHERGKQNVLVQTLSGLLADPVCLENEKLKDENASLRKNANLHSYLSQLVEENAKLRIENKVLSVQNDALCGKILSDHDKKREQEQHDRKKKKKLKKCVATRWVWRVIQNQGR